MARGEDLLCTVCRYELPVTNFHKTSQNKLNQMFYGRMSIENAFTYLYYYKKGVVQSILHQLKYNGQPEIGEKLGEWFANDLLEVFSPPPWDIIIPIPLHRSREKKRGYNQSAFFASGLSKTLGIPWSKKVVVRIIKSETQTRKSKAYPKHYSAGDFYSARWTKKARERASAALAAARTLWQLIDLVGVGPKACKVDSRQLSCVWPVSYHTIGYSLLARTINSKRKRLALECVLSAEGSERAEDSCHVRDSSIFSGLHWP